MEELAQRFKEERPSGYMSLVIPPWMVNTTAGWCAEAIQRHAPTAQAIAFRGLSGGLIAPIVAAKLGLNVLGVRKDHSHGGSTFHPITVHGERVQRAVILDDFVETGITVREIVKGCLNRLVVPIMGFLYGKVTEHEQFVELSKDIRIKMQGCLPMDFYQAAF